MAKITRESHCACCWGGGFENDELLYNDELQAFECCAQIDCEKRWLHKQKEAGGAATLIFRQPPIPVNGLNIVANLISKLKRNYNSCVYDCS